MFCSTRTKTRTMITMNVHIRWRYWTNMSSIWKYLGEPKKSRERDRDSPLILPYSLLAHFQFMPFGNDVKFICPGNIETYSNRETLFSSKFWKSQTELSIKIMFMMWIECIFSSVASEMSWCEWWNFVYNLSYWIILLLLSFFLIFGCLVYYCL